MERVRPVLTVIQGGGEPARRPKPDQLETTFGKVALRLRRRDLVEQLAKRQKPASR